mmetsp:Transcript_28117/g.42538  ORF Transcript_28117/g.42538 Transcript_28117/m.42538 type:complete len:400 (-) Transcript_28117:885-2084(-)
MFRQILRNIQNALVLSAVLLVILAFQRLQHYEVQSASYENLDENSSFSSSSTMIENDDISTLRSLLRKRHNPVFFGRLFRFGLMGFFSPALSDEHSSEIFANEENQQQQLLPKEEWRMPSSSSLIQYIVNFGTKSVGDLCTKEEAYKLDAARLLRDSLVEKKDVQHETIPALYTIFNDENITDHCNVTKILGNIGYNVVFRSSIEPHKCIHDESRLWEAYATDTLNADLVIHIPVTSVMIDKKKSSASSERSIHGIATKKTQQQRSPLSLSIYSSLQSIQFLWKSSRQNNQLRNPNNCSRYESPITCHSSPCQISKHKVIMVPPTYSKCRMPWTCSNTTNSGASFVSSSSSPCRLYNHIWTQQRTHLFQKFKTKNKLHGKYSALCKKGKYNVISQKAIE